MEVKVNSNYFDKSKIEKVINLKDVSMYPNLIKKLFQRGYSKSDINKILNDNFLRVWQEVEAYAEGK